MPVSMTRKNCHFDPRTDTLS